MPYQRALAVAYARQWAFARNPRYYNFDAIGGDCTNFVSQCLYAGCGVMNYTRDVGWYYRSLGDRSAAWTGVEYLHRFLTHNQGPGPYGEPAPLAAAELGDILQLSFDGARFSHSLLVTALAGPPSAATILLSTHTDDAENRPLDTYLYRSARLIHIKGARG